LRTILNDKSFTDLLVSTPVHGLLQQIDNVDGTISNKPVAKTTDYSLTPGSPEWNARAVALTAEGSKV
jgi:hypothetical protein